LKIFPSLSIKTNQSKTNQRGMSKNSLEILIDIIPKATQRTFNSMFGINYQTMDKIYEKYFFRNLKYSHLHLFWVFSFLKMYDTYDVLHALWGTSYNTYFNKIKELLDFMYETFDEIDSLERKNVGVSWRNYIICGIIDATECEILHPKDSQERYYYWSGYWGTTTLNYSLVCTVDGKKIIHVSGPYRGPSHDITMIEDEGFFLATMDNNVFFIFQI
jgi:hypothetical protein